MSASSPSSIPAADAIQRRGRNRAVGGEIAIERIDIGGAGDALIGALAEHRKAIAAIDQKPLAVTRYEAAGSSGRPSSRIPIGWRNAVAGGAVAVHM